MLALLAIFQLLSYSSGDVVRPTSTAHDGVTTTVMPEPTSLAMRRQLGFVNDDVLFARDLAPIACGYPEYDPAYPFTCPGDKFCGYDDRPGQFWGPACCSTQANGDLASDCTSSMITTCIDYYDTRNPLTRGSDSTTSERALYW